MVGLALAAAFFLGIHLLVSGTTFRDALVKSVGEGPYMIAFSLASLAGIVGMSVAYNSASLDPGVPLWDLGEGVKHAGSLVVGLAFLLGISGLAAPNPASIGQAALAGKDDNAKGMLRITRHPFLWGVALWAAFHLSANGDLPSVIFFGTFLLLATLGTYSIDAKRQRNSPTDWKKFSDVTSNVPFAAILSGRNKLVVSELLTFRQLMALLAFVVVMFTHHLAFGASPFPNGWVPF